jgi:hypothetical protein
MRLACVLVLSLCFFVGCGSSNDAGLPGPLRERPKNETTAVIRHGLAASSNVDLQAGSVIALSLPAEAAS